ncbi:hypothetical protein [Hymenobacter siberiensis]|uniref:hypothetical protein n=1 Tax=Hymenobacter siberiensis TaxID=2848396 RepID=UPI001C1E66E7|nr:hypothetical protein [Hymenobacter siberiensis]
MRQVLDYAFAPAVLLLALGNELAQVLLELDLLLIDLPQGWYWASRTRCFTAVSSWW